MAKKNTNGAAPKVGAASADPKASGAQTDGNVDADVKAKAEADAKAAAEAQAKADEAAAQAKAEADAKAAAEAESKAAEAAAAKAKAEADASDKTEYDHIVITRFKDKNDSSKFYEAGTSVNKFGAERLEDLVNRKLVERRPKA